MRIPQILLHWESLMSGAVLFHSVHLLSGDIRPFLGALGSSIRPSIPSDLSSARFKFLYVQSLHLFLSFNSF